MPLAISSVVYQASSCMCDVYDTMRTKELNAKQFSYAEIDQNKQMCAHSCIA